MANIVALVRIKTGKDIYLPGQEIPVNVLTGSELEELVAARAVKVVEPPEPPKSTTKKGA